MKVFVLALLLLVLIAGFVLWESCFVTRTMSQLLHMAEQFPTLSIFDPDYANQDFNAFQSAYTAFCDLWCEKKWILTLFLGHNEIGRIDGILEETAVRYLAEDVPGYRSARKKLITDLNRIRDQEKISSYFGKP